MTENQTNRKLVYAIAMGHAEIGKILLDAGADVKATDKKGNTLLHYIVLPPNDTIQGWGIDLDYETRGNHRLFSRQLIELLVENGVSLSDKNNEGETPLDWATQGSSQHSSRRSQSGGYGGRGGAVPEMMRMPTLPGNAADMLSF